MTKGLGLREYRACVRCRSRKTRCDLQTTGDPGRPPCAKCIREGADCVLAGSRRGGDFSRFRRPRKQSNAKPQPAQQTVLSNPSPETISTPLTSLGTPAVHDNLQNPSDALLILAHAAGNPEGTGQPTTSPGDINSQDRDDMACTSSMTGTRVPSIHRNDVLSVADVPWSSQFGTDEAALNSFQLIRNGSLGLNTLLDFLSSYRKYYHPFFPIVPAFVFDPKCIATSLVEESFLVTAVLAIASKDRTDLVDTHRVIWEHLRSRILDVVLGVASTRHVGYVEGLLLLGEWSLPSSGQTDDGDGEAAWSILGLAVRLAYRLRLEDSSFREGDHAFDAAAQRNRLSWTFTYLSDRQISIRMGQAFWCRGPALSARFTAQDFPSLQPRTPQDEDFASWIQAQVELTTLFGNAHDILFASKARTVELITRGDYVKYIDDTSRAMTAWQHAWQSIGVSSPLKSCLTLMQEYLRLYVNAFAFQAVIYRASRLNSQGTANEQAHLDFPNSAMASADARHIYEALDAAESLLRIFIENFDPETHLRYMPARFYLYEIHSSVFLFKAHASGAISSGRYAETAALIQRFIRLLTKIAVDENHIASRYAKLLQGLWFHRAGSSATDNCNVDGANADFAADPALGPPLFGAEASQGTVFDDVGLELFDGVDTIDGFFAVPPVFPYDLSVFFNNHHSKQAGVSAF